MSELLNRRRIMSNALAPAATDSFTFAASYFVIDSVTFWFPPPTGFDRVRLDLDGVTLLAANAPLGTLNDTVVIYRPQIVCFGSDSITVTNQGADVIGYSVSGFFAAQPGSY